MRLATAFAATTFFALGAACGGGGSAAAHTAATTARFDPAAVDPAQRDFFGLPYPTDLRRGPNGVELAGFPNPGGAQLLGDYEDMLRNDSTGFAGAAALYATFSGPVDASSLALDGAVYAADLDAGGARASLVQRYSDAAGLFLPAHALALLPTYGVPLTAGHRYALVITTAVKDAAGAAIGPTDAMRRALGLATATAADADAVRITKPFVDFAAAHAIDLKTIAAASVFTVSDGAAAMSGIRKGARALGEPALTDFAFLRTMTNSHVFVGHYPGPSFQQGSAPYVSSGGRIFFDSTGAAVVQRMESMRVALSIPKGQPPASGFPVVLYAHGTGGWYLQAMCEGIGDLLAARGIAVLGIDQVQHGPRNPLCHEPAPAASQVCLSSDANYETCVGVDYFNLLNPFAGRDNTRQGAGDLFQLIRLVPHVSVPASLHPEGFAAALDAGHVAFLGHSQGGLTGAPFAAAEPGLAASVLSGTGGTITITVLQRTDPLNFKLAIEQILGIDGKESLDPFHPVLSLVQTAAEPADPIAYAPHLVQAPLGGTGGSLMLTEGLLDPFTVADASEALGAAALLDIGGTAVHQSAGFTARGLHVLPLPLDSNASPPQGKRTAVLLQYPNDGHFAIFDNATAKCRYLGFLESALKTGTATVPGNCP